MTEAAQPRRTAERVRTGLEQAQAGVPGPARARTEADTALDLLEISIVMPCLNEEATVGICVRKARAWLERAGVHGEVIVVDNGSQDASVHEATAAGARVVFELRRGYGSALRRGIAAARGRYIVMGDCDDTYDFADLDPFLDALRTGADIALGNRYAAIQPGAMAWSHRYLGTPVITFFLRLFAGARVTDSQCGLRGFSRVAYERMNLHADGMEFASEMILKASRRGMVIKEVPIAYYPRVGEAKLQTFRDGWRHLRFLVLATPNSLYTVPGLLLALVGCAILAVGIGSPDGSVVIGPVTWQPVFAGSILLIVGLNALFFAGVAHLYTSALGITQRGLLYRIARQVFRFERVILGSLAMLAVGVALDLYLVAGDISTGTVPNRLGLAAVAHSVILSAGNFGLAGFLASLLRASDQPQG